MANGFEGFAVNIDNGDPIQKNIGFIGIGIQFEEVPNTYIQVCTTAGKPLRNTLVKAVNPTSGVSDSKTTDTNGNVALIADALTDIELSNGVFKVVYSYNRTIDDNQFKINFHIPPII